MNKNNKPLDILSRYETIFWDFDGVIKKSNQIKIDAFRNLFKDSQNLNLILKHHIENQGISRFKKIPLYLEMSGKNPSKKLIENYLKKFSNNLIEAVVESEWVEGALITLKSLVEKKNILITGTPKNEIDIILDSLKIKKYFLVIYGSPTNKVDAIEDSMRKLNIAAESAIFIGDSAEDINSATAKKIDVYFIKNDFNKHLSLNDCKYASNNFLNEDI